MISDSDYEVIAQHCKNHGKKRTHKVSDQTDLILV